MIVRNLDQDLDRADFKSAKIQYTLSHKNIEAAIKKGCRCHECGDTKFIPYVEYRSEIDRYLFSVGYCKCRNADMVNKKIEQSGLKNEIESKTFKSFVTDSHFRKALKDKAVEYLKDIKDGNKYWFYVGGQSGAGKSHICIAIANRFLQNNQRVVYMRWVDEMRNIKANLNDTSKIKEFKDADVLYIDDLFKGGKCPSDYDVGVVFELLNYRDCNNLVTIISSELTDCELRNIDEAVYGRIKMNTGDKFMISINRDEKKNYRVR